MKYSGSKSYNSSFTHEGTKDVKDATTYTVENLVPGTKYKFEVYRTSICGNKGSSASLNEETKMEGKQRIVNHVIQAIPKAFWYQHCHCKCAGHVNADNGRVDP